jgi:RNA polymerase sigma-70 factor (ECF subfamily)
MPGGAVAYAARCGTRRVTQPALGAVASRWSCSAEGIADRRRGRHQTYGIRPASSVHGSRESTDVALIGRYARQLATDDDDLVRRAGHGDAAAYQGLVERRVVRLFRTASAILGNEADAHDAVQEAFLSAWTNLPRLRNPVTFDAWLNRILVNRCRDLLRRRRRSQEVNLEAAAVLADRDDPADIDRLPIERAFEHLRVEQRYLLVLHHLDHLPVAEVARELAIPTGTAKWRLYQARRALVRALEAER